MSRDSDVAIVWFESNLRLADNAALAAATADGRRVLACYVLDAEDEPLGGASRWWLHHSLAALAGDLDAHGVQLVLRCGRADRVLAALAEETGSREVHAGDRVEPAALARQARVAQSLETSGVELRVHPGSSLFAPRAIATRSGDPFKVFTPFWRACLAVEVPREPGPAPRALRGLKHELPSDALDTWALLPRNPNWAEGFGEIWAPGEQGAHARLAHFLETGLRDYAEHRDRPDLAGTSRLSPHLHFGELSPRQVWYATRMTLAAQRGVERGGDAFLRELGWREFSRHLLFHWPTLPWAAFRDEFTAFPWCENRTRLAAWQRGRTGYPIVDAGMRELWSTGWMHNRVRMVVASFLVKHLLVSWRQGAAWFLDTLVDADLANNSASWQWVAGCGADAAPYFRIFNPMLQGQKFDPDGNYVRHWVPELENLPNSHLHAPWKAPKDVLERSGVVLGRDYPKPIVDHREARERALAAYRALRR